MVANVAMEKLFDHFFEGHFFGQQEVGARLAEREIIFNIKAEKKQLKFRF